MKILIKHILKLRELTSVNGDYSIRRSDGNPLEFWEIMTLSKLFNDIDEELKRFEKEEK